MSARVATETRTVVGDPGRPRSPDRSGTPAVHLEGVAVRAGAHTVLPRVDLEITAGTVVALAGRSGAGKTTLLEVMAGVRRPSSGRVLLGRIQRPAHEAAGSGEVGVVPQDDIIHLDLPLRRTLTHAARLRLPDSRRRHVDTAVTDVLDRLGLAERADVTVASLSGGQRKRASIAVELLTRPDVLFLDEPTSGLDPVSAREVVESLRALTGRGTTVVMTTHDPSELARCDRVVFLGPGGRLCFDGTPAEARRRFGVDDLADVYPLLASSTDGESADRDTAPPPSTPPGIPPSTPPASGHRNPRRGRRPSPTVPRGGASRRRQWLVLTARSAEVVTRNRLTLAILLGSPALVIAMMAVLFPAGAFSADGTTIGPAQTAFWLAFSAFFFGLTYGLLQVVTERAVLRRERFAGLSPTAYVASKVTLLMPLLAGVVVALLGVLVLLDRLPRQGWGTFGELAMSLLLVAGAGLVIGLAASAAVSDPAQATLALPMICFPQVLFAGAVVPVDQMAGAGAGVSAAMATRWSFESLGRSLHLAPQTGAAGTYHRAFTGSVTDGWLVLAAILALGAVGAVLVLRARTVHAGR